MYISVYICVCMCACVYEAANHRLIGAIRELAEPHSIAAPDGQLDVDTLHVDAHYTHTKHTHAHTAYIHKTHTLYTDTWCTLILTD